MTRPHQTPASSTQDRDTANYKSAESIMAALRAAEGWLWLFTTLVVVVVVVVVSIIVIIIIFYYYYYYYYYH